MNVQHSSRTDKWWTPLDILERVHMVVGPITLDPASSLEANERVRAQNIITEEQDGLTTPWAAGSLFLNPPGGKLGNKSKTALFWKRLMEHRETGKLTHAIFLAFSAEALQNTQGKGCQAIGEFPFMVPSSRIKFDRPAGCEQKTQPSHSNVIVYVPGTIDNRGLFYEAFKDMGTIINLDKAVTPIKFSHIAGGSL